MLAVNSPAWAQGARIPERYARYGGNVSPPVAWTGVPDDARSLVLVLVDHSANDWLHWIVADLPAGIGGLEEGASPGNLPAASRELANTFGGRRYDGPQPPAGSGEHEYELVLYALDTLLSGLPEEPLTLGGIEDLLGRGVVGRAVYRGVDRR